jgi:hypothetical protein
MNFVQLIKFFNFTTDFTKKHLNEVLENASIFMNNGRMGAYIIMVKEAEKKELLKRHADKNAIKVISYE